jgi:hypothetical protein
LLWAARLAPGNSNASAATFKVVLSFMGILNESGWKLEKLR